MKIFVSLTFSVIIVADINKLKCCKNTTSLQGFIFNIGI